MFNVSAHKEPFMRKFMRHSMTWVIRMLWVLAGVVLGASFGLSVVISVIVVVVILLTFIGIGNFLWNQCRTLNIKGCKEVKVDGKLVGFQEKVGNLTTDSDGYNMDVYPENAPNRKPVFRYAIEQDKLRNGKSLTVKQEYCSVCVMPWERFTGDDVGKSFGLRVVDTTVSSLSGVSWYASRVFLDDAEYMERYVTQANLKRRFYFFLIGCEVLVFLLVCFIIKESLIK